MYIREHKDFPINIRVLSRFESKKSMEAPGIPLTRWFDAVLLPKEQVDQKDNVRAMIVQGHASNSITRVTQHGGPRHLVQA